MLMNDKRRLLDSYDEFQALQRDYPRTLSNDFMLPEDIRKNIKHGKMSVEAGDGALFIYIERYGFTKVVFRLKDLSSRLPQIYGPLALYLVYRRANPPLDIASWLMSQGFRRLVSLSRHTAKRVTCELTSEGVEPATPDDAYSMLEGYFCAGEMDLPCRDMRSGGALCIREGGDMLGVIFDVGHARISAVSPSARGRGIGRRLYVAYAAHALAGNKDLALHEWIRTDNHASIAMVSKIGFSEDMLIASDCYIRD